MIARLVCTAAAAGWPRRHDPVTVYEYDGPRPIVIGDLDVPATTYCPGCQVSLIWEDPEILAIHLGRAARDGGGTLDISRIGPGGWVLDPGTPDMEYWPQAPAVTA